uniref:Ubiquitin-like protease family profile domain-containing protein n=1 Tax=Tetranychus urticae TaxID=32264 RepID=T1JZK8_TETUR
MERPFCITEHDFNSLLPGELVNDAIIDNYLAYLAATNTNVYSYSVYWYTSVTCPKAEGVFRFRKKPINTKKAIVFFPYSRLDHWRLIVVKIEEMEIKSCTYYDSYYKKSNHDGRFKNLILQHLDNVYKLKGAKVLQTGKCPKQKNGYDCGIYCLEFALPSENPDGKTFETQDNTAISSYKIPEKSLPECDATMAQYEPISSDETEAEKYMENQNEDERQKVEKAPLLGFEIPKVDKTQSMPLFNSRKTIYKCPYDPCPYQTKNIADLKKHYNLRYLGSQPTCRFRRKAKPKKWSLAHRFPAELKLNDLLKRKALFTQAKLCNDDFDLKILPARHTISTKEVINVATGKTIFEEPCLGVEVKTKLFKEPGVVLFIGTKTDCEKSAFRMSPEIKNKIDELDARKGHNKESVGDEHNEEGVEVHEKGIFNNEWPIPTKKTRTTFASESESEKSSVTDNQVFDQTTIVAVASGEIFDASRPFTSFSGTFNDWIAAQSDTEILKYFLLEEIRAQLMRPHVSSGQAWDFKDLSITKLSDDKKQKNQKKSPPVLTLHAYTLLMKNFGNKEDIIKHLFRRYVLFVCSRCGRCSNEKAGLAVHQNQHCAIGRDMVISSGDDDSDDDRDSTNEAPIITTFNTFMESALTRAKSSGKLSRYASFETFLRIREGRLNQEGKRINCSDGNNIYYLDEKKTFQIINLIRNESISLHEVTESIDGSSNEIFTCKFPDCSCESKFTAPNPAEITIHMQQLNLCLACPKCHKGFKTF